MVTAAVEGISDEAVVRRLLEHVGLEAGPIHISDGKRQLDRRLRGYNHAARFTPWIILRDLDSDADCAPTLAGRLVPEPAAGLLLRIPVRTVEAWLLADRKGVARYLGLRESEIPANPESLARPKRTLVDLARRSPRPAVRQDMVPEPQLSAEVGRAYTARLIEFAARHWDLEAAAHGADSLARCLKSSAGLARSWTG
jgi:hypothetical protein